MEKDPMRKLQVALTAVLATLASAASSNSQCYESEGFALRYSAGQADDRLGASVDASGEWIAAGAPYAEGEDGRVVLFRPGPLLEEVVLEPPQLDKSDRFGEAVRLHQDWLAVSETRFDSKRGRVHLYQSIGGVWTLMQTLEGTQHSDVFGRSLALDAESGLLAVGAAGAVDVFWRSGSTWTKARRLTPLIAGDFGVVVDVHGNRLAVGAPADSSDRGAAYLYEGAGLAWDLIDKLVPPTANAGDRFGRGLALEGDTLLVGAPDSDLILPDAGAVYWFEFDGSHWIEQQPLVPDDPQPSEFLGFGVELAGDIAAASSYRVAPDGNSGVVLQFRRQGDAWIAQQGLLANTTGNRVLSTPAIEGTTMVVGDLGDDDKGVLAGAVFGYEIAPLSFTATPSQPVLGDDIVLRTCGGAPGHLVMLFAVGVNDAPLFLRLAAGVLDTGGSWSLQAPYSDPALAGIVVDLQTYTIDGESKVRASNVASIEFQ